MKAIKEFIPSSTNIHTFITKLRGGYNTFLGKSGQLEQKMKKISLSGTLSECLNEVSNGGREGLG